MWCRRHFWPPIREGGNEASCVSVIGRADFDADDQGKRMPKAPEGAQLSPDGFYWWDGQQWQPVEQTQGQDQGQASGAYPNLQHIASMSADELVAQFTPQTEEFAATDPGGSGLPVPYEPCKAEYDAFYRASAALGVAAVAFVAGPDFIKGAALTLAIWNFIAAERALNECLLRGGHELTASELISGLEAEYSALQMLLGN